LNVQLQPHDFDGPAAASVLIVVLGEGSRFALGEFNQPVHGNLLHSGAMSTRLLMLVTGADAFS
jgi:hypothetical protein